MLRTILAATAASALIVGPAAGIAAADGPTATDPERPLEGKVAVVTGAANGIGAAAARRRRD